MNTLKVLLVSSTMEECHLDNLSLAAQAVLDAYGDFEAANIDAMAAALRSAALQIQFKDQLGLTAYGGHAQAQDQLLAIADELEF
jgi:DNA-directed RNA polymerase